tara:strand:- start:118 stop:387 length:270 start_codon:yes stop_codon:yes gene_type:complete
MVKYSRRFLKFLVKQRQLSPLERLANRFGYMGTAFIMVSPYLLNINNIGAITYFIGGLISIPQVAIAKQWNLVLLNCNLLVGYGIFLFI